MPPCVVCHPGRHWWSVVLAAAACGRTQLDAFRPPPAVDAATIADRAADLGSDVVDAPARDTPRICADVPPDAPPRPAA